MKTGILLTNLGSPSAPTPRAVRRYLKEFLWDKRVVDAFRPLWWLILNGIILNTRPAKTAELYQKIWTPQGSPLVQISQKQVLALQKRLFAKSGDFAVVLGMRYGEPSLRSAILEFKKQNCQKIVVLPLYPQFSFTTTGSTHDVLTVLSKRFGLPIRFVKSYAEHPAYLASLANSIREFWQKHGRPERLLFSYHGLPQRYVKNGDPYFHDCAKTTRALVKMLQLEKPFWQMGFQSRFGKEPWLKPYSDEILRKWGEAGIQNVQVICPGFPADCLETLEEIAQQYRDVFYEAGGERFAYIPALNDRADHIEALWQVILDQFGAIP